MLIRNDKCQQTVVAFPCTKREISYYLDGFEPWNLLFAFNCQFTDLAMSLKDWWKYWLPPEVIATTLFDPYLISQMPKHFRCSKFCKCNADGNSFKSRNPRGRRTSGSWVHWECSHSITCFLVRNGRLFERILIIFAMDRTWKLVSPEYPLETP